MELAVSLPVQYCKGDGHTDGEINYEEFKCAYTLRDEDSATGESQLRKNEENSSTTENPLAKDQEDQAVLDLDSVNSVNTLIRVDCP